MQKFTKKNDVISYLAQPNYFLLMLDVGIFHYHLVFTQFKHIFFIGAQAMWKIYLTTIGSRPKPE